ncbi:retropepsin-like aspartic protease [uncultured Chitinophaga sp.]|jgi:Predicted aspartyl protease|uniref:retropepsin-like aspartic protease family protein n=1 Tax=uncultured Chitinophaga sp. TaxID=339340 RepID=UPI002604C0D7|nr:retropepsin-like aspartic protease [uncultured Chitinophaga sp.]
MRTSILLALFCCTTVFSFAREKEHPDSLLVKRQFFALRNLLIKQAAGMKEQDRLYYHCFTDNFFNRMDASNRNIDQLLEKYRGLLASKQFVTLLRLKIDNLVKSYRYKEAYTVSTQLLSDYKGYLSPDEQEDILNETIIWESLQHAPPQQLSVTEDTRIPYQRDMAGLINIPVRITDTTQQFVFDTGANISVITESDAKRNGLLAGEKYFEVIAATGIRVKARTAVVKEMKIGDHILVKDAVFMIFPDSALTFGPYKIQGIIGFPVIEQMGEIRISDTLLTVPREPVQAPFANFGLDKLMPVLNVGYRTDSLPFTFDTGAAATDLNLPFYNKYQEEIKATNSLHDKQFGSAGGNVKISSYKLPEVALQIAGKTFRLKNAPVKTAAVTENDQYYYGNIGQDLMRRFREMVINFRYMYVDFRD